MSKKFERDGFVYYGPNGSKAGTPVITSKVRYTFDDTTGRLLKVEVL
jgi:hypothetical protein